MYIGFVKFSMEPLSGVMQQEVTRGRARKQMQVVRRIGVAEKAADKGHRYLTIVCDLDKCTEEHMTEDHTHESQATDYCGLTPEQHHALRLWP